MSKAILVMDMPESCSDCPCCYIPRCEVLEKSLKTSEPSEIYECKPDWCPLKPVPEKKQHTLYSIGASSTIQPLHESTILKWL